MRSAHYTEEISKDYLSAHVHHPILDGYDLIGFIRMIEKANA